VHSLHRFGARRATGIALAHYGLVPDHETVLEEAETILRRWAEVAEAAFHDGRDIAEALDQEFSGDLSGVPAEHREKLETLNGVHSNAAGFRRWLETRDSALE
jgi:hypothetical protein